MPKCGFLPHSTFISEGTAIKKRVTRFEMHQALKLQRGEIHPTNLILDSGPIESSQDLIIICLLIDLLRYNIRYFFIELNLLKKFQYVCRFQSRVCMTHLIFTLVPRKEFIKLSKISLLLKTIFAYF